MISGPEWIALTLESGVSTKGLASDDVKLTMPSCAAYQHIETGYSVTLQ